jgi:hypothetical protein
MPLGGRRAVAYWSEAGDERTELLALFIAWLLEHCWGTAIDAGWSDWDVEAHGHPWTALQVCTAQEDHGSGKQLICVRYRLRLTPFARAVGVVSLTVAAAIGVFDVACGAAAAAVLGGPLFAAWWRGAVLARDVVEGFDGLARGQGLIRCEAARAGAAEADDQGGRNGAP